MRQNHLVLVARARWRVAFVLFLLAAALSVWLMGANSTSPPLAFCGNGPVDVDSTVAQRWARQDSVRLSSQKARFGADVHIKRGEHLFKTECAACHKPDRDMTGPALKRAVLQPSSPTWFRTFLTAQDSLLRIKDPYTTELHKQWGNYPWRHERTGLSPAELNDLMAWVEQYGR